MRHCSNSYEMCIRHALIENYLPTYHWHNIPYFLLLLGDFANSWAFWSGNSRYSVHVCFLSPLLPFTSLPSFSLPSLFPLRSPLILSPVPFPCRSYSFFSIFPSLPPPPFPVIAARRSGRALKLHQRVRAQPGR